MLATIDHGSVRELRLERPPVNALSPELITTLRDAILEASEEDPGAIVLSGGEGMFSAGLDIPAFLALDRGGVRQAWMDFFGLMKALVASPIPIAAAVTGHAPAGGCVLAMCCEQRVMAEGSFKLGLNEVQVGVAVPRPIVALARHVVGPRQAQRLCTTATLIDTEEAQRIGLVDELVPLKDVVPRAIAWAEMLLALPPRALARTRALSRRELLEIIEVHDAELDRFMDEWFGEETQEALRAVMEKLAAKK